MSKMKRKWIQDKAVGAEQLDPADPLITQCGTEPPDSELESGMMVVWFDDATKECRFKAKGADGRYYTEVIRLKRRK